jgi:hypothetical protein
VNPDDILPLLEPLRAPEAVSWWPPAPGWWLVATLTALLLIALLRRFRQRWRAAAPLRSARRELAWLRAADTPPSLRAAQLAQLQRRVAIALHGRRACARLSGADWVDFLNRMAGDALLATDSADLAYRPDVDATAVERALDDCQRWLQRLRSPR